MNYKFVLKDWTPEIESIYEDSNAFRNNIRRLEHGTKSTPRTWFYEEKSPAWILDQLVSKLNGMQDLKLIADWDLAKAAKFAPQGESAPFAQRLDTFNEYFEHLNSPRVVKDPLWQKAKQIAVKELGFNESGHPITAQQVVDRGMSEDKYNTSSGYPLYMRRKTDEARRHAVEFSNKAIELRYPTTVGTRANIGHTGKDARHIFMGSMDVNVCGQRFQQPLQDFIRKRNLDFFIPWEGWDKTQEKISAVWKSTFLKFGADYSKMDQHFNKYHGFECYDVIKHYFHPSHWEELHVIIDYVFTMPIITNLGLIDQDHAMPSGSEWTNFLETVWNFIFSIYLRLKYHLKFELAMGIGDDQLWMLSGIDASQVDWLIDTVMSEFDNAGLPGNREKQEVSFSKTGFLQRLLCNEWSGKYSDIPGAGVYSLIRNTTSQVFPEFYHDLKKDPLEYNELFALRVIMIAENTSTHPLFEWYVKDFIAKANKNILEFVRRKDAELVDVWQRAKKVANFLPTYNQAMIDQSILNFRTVQLLRQVA